MIQTGEACQSFLAEIHGRVSLSSSSRAARFRLDCGAGLHMSVYFGANDAWGVLCDMIKPEATQGIV